MNKLYLNSLLNDEGIAVIASCVDKIEKLIFVAPDVTIGLPGLKNLSTAINNRPTPVSWQKN